MKSVRSSTFAPTLGLLVLLAGCSSLSANVSEEHDPYAADGETYSHSVSFENQDDFARARDQVTARDFDAAIAIYRNLYQTSTDREVQARALLEWARAERNPFNPARDPDAADARLNLLLESFGDTDYAVTAKAELGLSPKDN